MSEECNYDLCFAPRRKALNKIWKKSLKRKNLLKIYGCNQEEEQVNRVYLCGTPSKNFIDDSDHADVSHIDICDGRYHTYTCTDPMGDGLQSWGHPCDEDCETYKRVCYEVSTINRIGRVVEGD